MLVIKPSVVRIAGGWIMTCFSQFQLRTRDVMAPQQHRVERRHAGQAIGQQCDQTQRAHGRDHHRSASYPGGSGDLNFADGQAENLRWMNPRTQPKLTDLSMTQHIHTPNNREMSWLQERSTALKH